MARATPSGLRQETRPGGPPLTAPITVAPALTGWQRDHLELLRRRKVVDHYNVMGPVKAALEASVRYLVHELGPRRIRVNAISTGAVASRAATGIEHFDELLNKT